MDAQATIYLYPALFSTLLVCVCFSLLLNSQDCIRRSQFFAVTAFMVRVGCVSFCNCERLLRHTVARQLYLHSLFFCVCFQFEQLSIVVVIDCRSDRAHIVQQSTVALVDISCDDACMLGADEIPRFQLCHIFSHHVSTQIHCFADGLVAGVAHVGSAFLNTQQVAINRNRSIRRPMWYTSFGIGV